MNPATRKVWGLLMLSVSPNPTPTHPQYCDTQSLLKIKICGMIDREFTNERHPRKRNSMSTATEPKCLSIEEFEALPDGTIFRANGFLTVMTEVQRWNSDSVHDDAGGYVTEFMSAEELASRPVLMSSTEITEEGRYYIFLLGDGSSNEYEDSFSIYHRMADRPWSSTHGFRLVNSW
jgi:hypothetical protein